MLENDSWAHPSGGVCLASNDTKIDSHCLKNGNLGTVGIGIRSNNPVGAAMVNGHNLFENDHEEKESSDLSFVGWPDIVTLEDAETMLRSFNSTFGYGELCNEDEFSWFSSQCIDGSDALMKSDLRFPFSESSLLKHIAEQDGPPRMVNTSSSVNESDCITFDGSATKAQVSNHKKQTKIYNQSEGNMKNQHLENCGSYNDGIEPHSFGYLQTGPPFSQPGMMSESNGVTTLSSSHVEEFSIVSNGVAPMDGSIDISFEVPSVSRDDQSKKLHDGYLSNPNYVDAASCDPKGSTQLHISEVENHCEVKEARKRTLENIDFSKVPEASCLSSELEATSLEASRLSQLQQVMHQLDTKTKLCLRDGLYRLARSAEQRHISASAKGRSLDDGDTNEMLIDEETKESNGLMDIETETNPIDRSIAHLLFHRPSDSSANSACDGSSLKSHTMVDEFMEVQN